MKNFITPEEFMEYKDPVVIDVCETREIYDKEHIRGSYYLDLEEDLSGKVTEMSGNHPLPEAKALQKKLRLMGINDESSIIIVDNGENFIRGRAWFDLKYFGLKDVKVLITSKYELKKYGVEFTSDKTEQRHGNVTLKSGNMPLCEYDEIVEYSKNRKNGQLLLDNRPFERYKGDYENLYSIAGHIPNASGIFARDFYNEDGTLKSAEELEKLVEPMKKYDDLILSCGSGVNACTAFIAIDEMGLNPRVYIGSYSQWLKRGNEVEKGVNEY